VLCGGTSELTGIKGFAREILDMPVRIGEPRDMEGFVDRVSKPAFATSIGLLRWGWAQNEIRATLSPARSGQRKGNPFGGLFGWARRAFLPG
jgi:cell division protein FtsA